MSKNNTLKSKGIFAILILGCFGILFYSWQHVNLPISGDEPNYLLMDYSLVHDHDLNIANNFLNKNYVSFYPSYLSPYQQVDQAQLHSTNKQYSVHGAGLPILLLPGFLLGGVYGAGFEMVIIATIVIGLTWWWTLIIVRKKWLATLTAATLTISYFFTGLAGYIYPDMIIAGIILLSLIFIEKFYKNFYVQVIFGLMLGLLIFVHFKTLAIAVPLLMAMSYKTWKWEHKLPWATLILFAPMLIYFIWLTRVWFGVWNPVEIYSGVSLHGSPYYIISAMLFDSMRGLIVNNPIVALVVVGLPIWLRVKRDSFAIILLILLPSIAILATFAEWQGGDAPIGRYIVDFLPALMPAFAFVILRANKLWQRIGVIIVIAINLLITIDSVLIKRFYIRNSLISPLFIQLKRYTGISFNHFLPTFSTNSVVLGSFGQLKVVFGYIILVVFFGFGYYISKLQPKEKN